MVRYVSAPGAGSAAAFDAGLTAAHGEYLVFLDADDRLLPHALQTGLNCFHLYPESALVRGRWRYVAAEGHDARDAPEPPPSGYSAPAAVMYRRDAVQPAGGFGAAQQGCAEYALQLRIARERPAPRHGVLVAERLLHDLSRALDAAVTLREALATLNAERATIGDDPQKLREWRASLRFARKSALAPLRHRVQFDAAARRRRSVLELPLAIARYLPLWAACRWQELRAPLGRRP